MHACMCQSMRVAARGQLARVLSLLPHGFRESTSLHHDWWLASPAEPVQQPSGSESSAALWVAWRVSRNTVKALLVWSYGRPETWATLLFFPCAHQWTSYGQAPWVYFRVYFSVICKVLSAFSSAFIQPVPPQCICSLSSLFCDFSLSKKCLCLPLTSGCLFFVYLVFYVWLSSYPTVLPGGINCSNSRLPWANRKSRV